MKRSKFSEAQVALILRQADEGATVGEVCRKAGISEATFYVWRKKVRWPDAVGDEAPEAARGRERPAETHCGGSDAGPGDAAAGHQAKALGPARRRQVVDHLRATWQVSIRRACGALQAERSSYHYRGKRVNRRLKGTPYRRAIGTPF